ncbi:hypothetical protein Pmar_PMAR017787 [Perkinsus marinus ATCC 50983]|uniref:Uncharacterized protein n=1 Tax=Perkinsus marinus (strain ATCC 50983 / TXsc) TaxID=423536 RepID=C5L3Z9_PERM5|nr:hypothetical protein Pmar_PMAR017787 [Perkinsus marinus ATCC 50983]EER08728.1 hypothetical protein Pmar_PMAR017787 [Perkinsus marinus ATCC 50983]|eukprot:XP_002776912.1 hypothetical protein Pmar_PMAR017787 [Perkinsus marinus ATCC 50983]
MVTAVELNSSINAASTREDLSRLRSTARRLRTNNCKKRTEIQERLADNDIDDNKLALLETEEATLEAEIIALSGAADNASSKINALMRETCMVNSATLSADDSNNNATATPTSAESVSGLVRALSSALSRRPYDSRTKRADINRLPMQGRSLIDPYQLPAHFRRLEKWFASNEFGTFDDSTKAFVADKEVEAQLVEKAIESLSSHRNVASEANTLVDTYGATWNHLKNTLIDKFAKPEDIRRELNRKISQLTYKGHSNVDGFISELRQIHTLASTVNSSPEDSVYFIDDILRCLPPNVHSQLVQEINQTARICRHNSSSTSSPTTKPWQLKLPLDAPSDQHSIFGILSDVAQSLLASTDFRKVPPESNRGSRREDMGDKISKVSDSTTNSTRAPPSAITEARRQHKEANDWARKQNFVIIVMGKALRSSTPTDPGFNNASDVRFLVSRQGKRYGLVAFDSKADAEKVIAEYFSNKDSFTLVKPYDPDFKSKNDSGRRSQ